MIDVYAPNVINHVEPVEYHRRVAWLHDLRDGHITLDVLRSLIGYTPRGAVQELLEADDRDALMNHFRQLPVVPTCDPETYAEVASTVRRYGPMQRPVGILRPKRTSSSTPQFYRDARVHAWTLQRAGGCCELCDRPAPFRDKYGEPYLESHHIVWLANDGPDTPHNTAAICPNCHRELHHGAGRAATAARLLTIVSQKEAAIDAVLGSGNSA